MLRQDTDAMKGAVHRGPDEVAKPGVDHDEALAASLLVRLRILDVAHARDQGAGRCHEEPAGLDLDPDRAPGALAEEIAGPREQRRKRPEIGDPRRVAI